LGRIGFRGAPADLAANERREKSGSKSGRRSGRRQRHWGEAVPDQRSPGRPVTGCRLLYDVLTFLHPTFDIRPRGEE
jgi:hypothetical protein